MPCSVQPWWVGGRAWVQSRYLSFTLLWRIKSRLGHIYVTQLSYLSIWIDSKLICMDSLQYLRHIRVTLHDNFLLTPTHFTQHFFPTTSTTTHTPGYFRIPNPVIHSLRSTHLLCCYLKNQSYEKMLGSTERTIGLIPYLHPMKKSIFDCGEMI